MLSRAGSISFYWGASPRRLELHASGCWMLFITGGVLGEMDKRIAAGPP